jgi:hypothetical protein
MIIPETFAVKGEIIGIGIWSTENLSHSDATYKVHVYTFIYHILKSGKLNTTYQNKNHRKKKRK